jgi:hypothetical protein
MGAELGDIMLDVKPGFEKLDQLARQGGVSGWINCDTARRVSRGVKECLQGGQRDRRQMRNTDKGSSPGDGLILLNEDATSRRLRDF